MPNKGVLVPKHAARNAGQISLFDVFASERACSGPAMHCFQWEWQDEIFQGVICEACTRVCWFSNTVCALKEAENMTCPLSMTIIGKNVYKRTIKNDTSTCVKNT